MATNSPKVRVVLRRPKSVVSLIAFVKAIGTAVTAAKVTFPTPNPTMAQLTSDLGALELAQTATHTRAKGTVEVRDAKLAIVVADLVLLRNYVQQVADADPSNAAAIAQSAGMGVGKVPKHGKDPLTAKPGTTTGSVEVAVRATSPRESHEWQYSLDGGKTWASSPPTLQAKTTITGLTAGTIALVRHRAVTKTGPEDWSEAASVVVH